MKKTQEAYAAGLEDGRASMAAEVERLRTALERIAMYLADGDTVFAIQEIARKTLNEQITK